MELNYIFILKPNATRDMRIEKRIKMMLLDLFSNKSYDDCLTIIDNNINYEIKYKISRENDDLAYVKFECNYTEAQSALALDKIAADINTSNERRDFQIIKSYDEASLSFCCRLMKPFGTYERRLRELIYLTIVRLFGEEWFEKTFSEDLKDSAKKTAKGNQKKLIEGALEELTYEELKSYLFDPIRMISLDDLVDNRLSNKAMKELTKEEMINIIESSRKISLWDRFFYQNKQLSKVSEDIEYLREYRNKVMHHKAMTAKEFIEVKSKLRSVNMNMKKAIAIMENKIYDTYDITSVAQSLLEAFKSFLQTPEGAALAKSISQLINNFITQNKIIEALSRFAQVYQEKTKMLISSGLNNQEEICNEDYEAVCDDVNVE